MPYFSLAKYAATFGAGLLVMWLYHDAAMSRMVKNVALEQQKVAEQSNLEAQKLQDRISAADALHTQELTNAKADNDRLAADLASGAKRVYIRAKCPAVPVADTAGSGNAETAELSADARQSFLHLRELLIQKEYQVSILQALLQPQAYSRK